MILFIIMIRVAFGFTQFLVLEYALTLPKSVTPLKCSTAISRTNPPPEAINMAISTGVQPT